MSDFALASPGHTGSMRALLRVEAAFEALVLVALYARLGASWWWLAFLFLAPDLSFLGYLAGPRVGHAEHGAVDHVGVAVQHGLDLRGGDLEAAHLDHLLAAVGEVDPAFGLQPADVPGPVPTVGEGVCRGLVE